MNPQPFQNPPRSWPSLLSPRFIDRTARWRNRELHRQGIEQIHTTGAENVRAAIQAGYGVLLVSNHSYHYDSYVLIEAGRRSGWYPHIMTAWQVFMMYHRLGRWFLQKHGCFSINREGNDTQAFRHSISVLISGSHPLLIYPEGDIYHCNDRVMPFREGAAAIALLASKKNQRPIVILPCAMKCFYSTDPTLELHAVMDRLEERIGWRPARERSLLDRIYRFGNGFLASKEVEYLGISRTGTIRERLTYLANTILTQIRERHHLPAQGKDLPQKIRFLRIHLISLMSKLEHFCQSRRGLASQHSAFHQAKPFRRRHRRDQTGLATSQGSPAQPTCSDRNQNDADVLKSSHVAKIQNTDSAETDSGPIFSMHQLQIDMQDLFFVTQLSSYHGDYSAENPTIERLAETIDKFEEDVFSLQAPTPRGKRIAHVHFGMPIELHDKTDTAAQLTQDLESAVQELLNSIRPPRDLLNEHAHRHWEAMIPNSSQANSDKPINPNDKI